jgi:hypothetical protein
MKKNLLYLAVLFLSCGANKQIQIEKDLLQVTGMSSLSYKIEMEYNELDKMMEGIYLCDIILEKKDAEQILDNIIQGKIKNLSVGEYVFHTWKKGPIQDDYDSSFFYYSPVPNKVQKKLLELKHSLSSADIYYAHFQSERNPFIWMLYIFAPDQSTLMIYCAFF